MDISLCSAEFYGNEAEVGKAIKASGVKREDLFLCSKVRRRRGGRHMLVAILD